MEGTNGYKEKMKERVARFHCPRYDELPSVDLYLDQVISILGDQLKALYPREGEHVVTGTMINNYVKCRAIASPVRKKYSKDHLCYMFAVCIFKRVFSIEEITRIFDLQKNSYSVPVAYDYLCTELENALRVTFRKDGSAMPSIATAKTNETELVRSMVLAVANKVYVQAVIRDSMEQETKEEKE